MIPQHDVSPPFVSLRLVAMEAGREKLELRLGDWIHRGSTYYLQLDPKAGKSKVDPDGADARVSLTRLLEQWRDAIAVAEVGKTFFLPFDFDDESTGWLRGRANGDAITFDVGWSELEGWKFLPSRISAAAQQVSDFDRRDDAPVITAPRAEWLRLVEASIDSASGTLVPRPVTDPTPLFELFRGSYGTELLTAAVAHFNLFGVLSERPLDFQDLGACLGLQSRPLAVLTTAMRAMGLLTLDDAGRLRLTALAEEHLSPGGPLDVGDYIGLAAAAPGVLEMVERLRTNRPASSGGGTAFIYRAGVASAMEQSELARHFTMALAGRAKNVAPHLARAVDLSEVNTILDVAGGTGIYSIAMLERYPRLKAIVLDRPEVLKVAAEFADRYGVGDRLELLAADMFSAPWPQADAVLLSNVLHDWDVPTCQELLAKSRSALTPAGRVLIHDVFLNDTHDGPLAIALYSAALFTLTEGRAYSVGEYRSWLASAGFEVEGPVPTLVHCGVMQGRL
ncbi:MAG: methyltransferase [Planctomycetaceae bacterium]